MNKMSSLFQDIEIRYYWMMSRLAQSQRESSSRIAYINLDSSNEYAITAIQDSHLHDAQTEKIEFEKKIGAVA